MHFDVDMDHADSRSMTADRTGDGVFTRKGEMLIYGVKLDAGQEVRLELFEKPTDITKLQNMLIAELNDNKEEWISYGMSEDDANRLVSEATTWIKTLTLADFTSYTEDNAPNKSAYSEGAEATTTITYTSKAKDLNDKKVYNMQTLVLLV